MTSETSRARGRLSTARRASTSHQRSSRLLFEAGQRRPEPEPPIIAGGVLTIEYEPGRAGVAEFGTDQNGQPKKLRDCGFIFRRVETLAIVACVKFLDGAARPIGQLQRACVLSRRRSSPAVFRVPIGARRLRLYFEATNYLGTGAWDSNGGNDFSYPAQPATPEIRFPCDGAPRMHGALRSPGEVVVLYDPLRMAEVYLSQSRDARDGSIAMYVAFDEPANPVEHSVLKRRRTSRGGPVVDLTPKPVTVQIPDNVSEMQIWFMGRRARRNPSWDSDFGRNYRFPIA